MPVRHLHLRRHLRQTDFHGLVASRAERTTLGQIQQINGSAGDGHQPLLAPTGKRYPRQFPSHRHVLRT